METINRPKKKRIRRITAEVPLALHTKLKIKAVRRHTNIKKILVDALEEKIEKM